MLLGLAFVTGAVVALAAWSSSLASQLEQKRAFLREKGFPVTLEELAAEYPPVPEQENAAPVYAEAFAQLEEVDPEGERVNALLAVTRKLDVITDCPPDRVAELQDFVVDVEPAVEKLSLAVSRPRVRFPIDFRSGIGAEQPHLSQLKNAARVLRVSSEAALGDGDEARAVEHHAAILSLSHALLGDPGLMSQLARVKMIVAAFDGLQLLLNDNRFDDTQLIVLDDYYKKAYHPETLRYAMITERCMAIDSARKTFDGTIRMMDDETRAMVDQIQSFPQALVTRWFCFEQLQLYKAFEALIVEADPDWAKVAIRAREVRNHEATFSIITAILMPSFDRAPIAFVRSVAAIRVARAAIAVERHRLAHAALPSSLDDCVPDFLDTVPEDPFDGAPLRYRVETNGYTLYSIYDDLEDNGGTPWVSDDEYAFAVGDLVFTMAR